MNKTKQTFLFFTIIILEGYVVLSAELLAIRQTLPFIGSGSDTISIIIAAVLMPLAFGYYAGGQFKPGFRNGKYRSIRKKLLINMFIAQLFFISGLSYLFLSDFFTFLIRSGIDNRLALTALYSGIFIVTPVYLLGQTIPLISNYFSKENLAQVTGRILFFSTIGSFMGAVFSTIVLMATIGVHNTAAVVFIILTALIFALSKKKINLISMTSLTLVIIATLLNSSKILSNLNIVENNQYNTIVVRENKNTRYLLLNNNYSSKYSDSGSKFENVEFMEALSIKSKYFKKGGKDILVIGAGAFTFGLEDLHNDYDVVDIDASLKDIAEKHVLKQKIPKNKIFHAVPIRAFLTKTDKKYDLIIIDVFKSGFAIPEHLVTREFFIQVKEHLKDNGIVLANFTSSPNFASKFSRIHDNTFRSVFPHFSRHIMNDGYKPWNNDENIIDSAIYIYRNNPETEADANTIYTDNKNRVFLDRPAKAF